MSRLTPPRLVTSSRSIYTGKVFRVVEEDLKLADGKVITRAVVRHGGAAVILPVTAGGQLILIRQYRHPARATLLELPAGTIDEGESPLECARRELVEEIGYAAAEWLELGSFYSAPGFCSELLTSFLARDLTPATAEKDEDEEIEVVALSHLEVEGAIERGEIADAKTLSTLFLARLRHVL